MIVATAHVDLGRATRIVHQAETRVWRHNLARRHPTASAIRCHTYDGGGIIWCRFKVYHGSTRILNLRLRVVAGRRHHGEPSIMFEDGSGTLVISRNRVVDIDPLD